MPLAKELGHKMEGRVTVRAPRYEYSFPFIDYLFAFRKENPSIDVAVLPWSPTDGVDDVLSGDVDLAYIGHAAISMGYDAETSNTALLHLVEFLEARMPAT